MSQLKEHSIGEEASTLSAAVNTSGGGVQLDFLDIRYSVALQGSFGRGGGRKDILKGITGRCTPGRMLAIMGSSGAGKTTLLDILACNAMPSGKVEGTVLVNGAPRNAAAFRRNSCYVLQRDVLLSTATVRESIATSALLKLPRKLSTADKMAQVDRVLNQLGLVECQNTLIGDELVGMKGISGGQRRRVSIGIELVKNPQVIFLDEPTSGLDSEMAVSLVETLVSLSSGNRTVVLTIHQPNSLITSKFDDFLLLTNGEAAYNGPWTGAVDFFSAVGLSCPQYMNPTDFFLNVLQEEPARDALVERQRKATDAAADLEAAGGTSPGVKGVGVALHIEQSGGEEGKALKKKGRVGGAPEAPAWFQASILARRNLRM